MTFRILIVSAWEPEQAWLKENVFHNPNMSVEFVCVGVGSLCAALSLERYLSSLRENNNKSYDAIVFLATAGVYNKANVFSPHTVFCQNVEWLDAAEKLKQSFLPPQVKKQYQSTFAAKNTANIEYVLKIENVLNMESLLVAKNEVKCFSTYAIHSCVTLLESLFEKNILKNGDVENLEFFGLAEVCQYWQIPLLGIFGVSNVVGKNAHAQWKTNHKLASEMAGRAALEFLKKFQ